MSYRIIIIVLEDGQSPQMATTTVSERGTQAARHAAMEVGETIQEWAVSQVMTAIIAAKESSS